MDQGPASPASTGWPTQRCSPTARAARSSTLSSTAIVPDERGFKPAGDAVVVVVGARIAARWASPGGGDDPRRSATSARTAPRTKPLTTARPCSCPMPPCWPPPAPADTGARV